MERLRRLRELLAFSLGAEVLHAVVATRYFAFMKQDIITPLPPKGNPWRDNEFARRLRLREAAARSLSVNLAEGIALSHQLMQFKGSARHS